MKYLLTICIAVAVTASTKKAEAFPPAYVVYAAGCGAVAVGGYCYNKYKKWARRGEITLKSVTAAEDARKAKRLAKMRNNTAKTVRMAANIVKKRSPVGKATSAAARLLPIKHGTTAALPK